MKKSAIQRYVADQLDLAGYGKHMWGWVKPGRLELITRNGNSIRVHLPASSRMKLDEVESRLREALDGTAPPAPPMPAWVPKPGSLQLDIETLVLQTRRP